MDFAKDKRSKWGGLRYEDSRSVDSNSLIQRSLGSVKFVRFHGETLRKPKKIYSSLDLAITNQAISHGIECKLQAVVDTQLLENVTKMRLYGLFTNKQLTGNFFVSVPRRY